MSTITDGMPIGFHPLYHDALSPEARFPRQRYPLLKQAIDASQMTEEWIQWFEPRKATVDEITDIHDIEYVHRFLNHALTPKEQRQIGLRPWTREIVERTLHLTGGTIQAVEFAYQSNGYAGNLAGGTHHAYREHGAGYCIFNDIAIGAIKAIELGCSRISIIDLDVHQGDGTAAICKDYPAIQTISVHCQKNYPFHKQTSDVDIPLEVGCRDARYLEAVQKAITASETFQPDFLFYQAGVDPLESDKLGHLLISREGLQARNRLVFDYIDKMNIPCVVLMGGGYAEPIDDSVDCLKDLYQEAARRHKRRKKVPHVL